MIEKKSLSKSGWTTGSLQSFQKKLPKRGQIPVMGKPTHMIKCIAAIARPHGAYFLEAL